MVAGASIGVAVVVVGGVVAPSLVRVLVPVCLIAVVRVVFVFVLVVVVGCCWLSGVGCWVLAVGCWFVAVGC